MQLYYGFLATNTRTVPALLMMQTTLKITLCNNLRDINLSILCICASSQWFSAIAGVFCCQYLQNLCPSLVTFWQSEKIVIQKWFLESITALSKWITIKSAIQYDRPLLGILIIHAYQYHSPFKHIIFWAELLVGFFVGFPAQKWIK